MGKDMVSLTIEGEVRQYPAGTSFLAISQEYQEKYPDDNGATRKRRNNRK